MIDEGPKKAMMTGPASRLFETQRHCSRPGNLSGAFGGEVFHMFGFFRKKAVAPDDDLNPNRAVEFFKRGDFQEALRRADAMITAGPQVSLSWRFKGECLFSMERYTQAVECFETAESIGGPGTEDMFLWKALALHNGGQSEQAKQVVRDFLASGVGAQEWVAKAKNALAQLG